MTFMANPDYDPRGLFTSPFIQSSATRSETDAPFLRQKKIV